MTRPLTAEQALDLAISNTEYERDHPDPADNEHLDRVQDHYERFLGWTHA